MSRQKLCKNKFCNAPLNSEQRYFCSDECKLLWYWTCEEKSRKIQECNKINKKKEKHKQIKIKNKIKQHEEKMMHQAMHGIIKHKYPSQIQSWLKLRFEVLKRDNFICQYCGKTPANGIRLHIDHIHPKSKGGTDDMDNLITSCSDCNHGKRDVCLSARMEEKIKNSINV